MIKNDSYTFLHSGSKKKKKKKKSMIIIYIIIASTYLELITYLASFFQFYLY